MMQMLQQMMAQAQASGNMDPQMFNQLNAMMQMQMLQNNKPQPVVLSPKVVEPPKAPPPPAKNPARPANINKVNVAP